MWWEGFFGLPLSCEVPEDGWELELLEELVAWACDAVWRAFPPALAGSPGLV